MRVERLFSFLKEFTRNTDATYTVIVMDDEQMEQPRRYRVKPLHVWLLAATVIVAFSIILVALLVLTPIREVVPGYGTAELRRSARLNDLRLVALQDSLATQQQYLAQLRHLITGEVDSTYVPASPRQMADRLASGDEYQPTESITENWSDHEQPAVSVVSIAGPTARPLEPGAGAKYISSLQLPTPPPVGGFLTRGFDVRAGHFAVDIAVDEGTMVRSIGDGYVIFADWTQEGGYAIAVQHADGFVSVYKHNRRLLKREGDRVRNREAVAESGNTGEITTGPHLHVEIWHNGLAQDPQHYFVGL